jgi:hypothetical protein
VWTKGCIPFPVNMRVYLFSLPAVCELEGIFISTVNSVDVRVFSQGFLYKSLISPEEYAKLRWAGRGGKGGGRAAPRFAF